MKGGWPKSLDAEIATQVTKVEKQMGRKLGDAKNPLLVSVRSGAKFSMPGMMDTVLNLGLNDKSVEGLATTMGDERFAFDSYRRFISMYGRIVLGVDGALFEHAFDTIKTKSGVTNDAAIPAKSLRQMCDDFKKIVKRETKAEFPQDPKAQLRGAVEAVFESWNGARAIAYRVRERIPHELGTAVNVQTMVFGNLNDNSGHDHRGNEQPEAIVDAVADVSEGRGLAPDVRPGWTVVEHRWKNLRTKTVDGLKRCIVLRC